MLIGVIVCLRSDPLVNSNPHIRLDPIASSPGGTAIAYKLSCSGSLFGTLPYLLNKNTKIVEFLTSCNSPGIK